MRECTYIMGVYKVCVDDRVTVRVGNRQFSGVVKGISNMGLLLVNDNHPVLIKLSKINIIEVHRPYSPPEGGGDEG